MNASRYATIDDIDAELASRELARRHLVEWCEYGPPTQYGRFRPKAWQRDLCRRLESLTERIKRGDRVRVAIHAPPQAGKSEIVARRWPTWLMAQHGLSVALCSYADTLAVEHSAAARSILSSPEAGAVWERLRRKDDAPLLGHDGRPVVDRMDDWGIPAADPTIPPRRYLARGVGGGLSGRSIDLVIIDDPFKDKPAADSKANREAVWSWYTSAVHARVNERGGALVIMHTRWHLDDLIGKVLAHAEATGERWEVWSYGVTAGENDILGREPGALLEGWTPERVRETRALDERLWWAAYEGQPTPDGGAIIDRAWTLRRHTLRRHQIDAMAWDDLVLSADLTFGRSETSDYVSMQVWGRLGADRYLLDRVCARMTYPEARAAFLDMVGRWPGIRAKLIEKAANGTALVDELDRQVPGMIPVKVTGQVVPGKFATTAYLWHAGNIILPDPSIAPWVGEYVETIVSVPQAPHDDDAAATAHALTYFDEQQARGADPLAYIAGLRMVVG